MSTSEINEIGEEQNILRKLHHPFIVTYYVSSIDLRTTLNISILPIYLSN